MALHKLEIADGQLMLDDAFAGLLSSSPPEGVTATTLTFTEEGVVAVKIRWTIETVPGHLSPLEILGLRLGEFFPKAAFVGGRKYQLSEGEPIRGRKLGFPYNTYYKFRINSRAPYDAALFSKMPIACWQGKDRAFAVIFPKELVLPAGPVPLFIRAGGVGAGVDFSAAILREFEVVRKPVGWFGAHAKRANHTLALPEGQFFEATFLLMAADTWVDCVRKCEEHLYETRRPPDEAPAESLAKKLNASLRYYNRVWDSRNRTHVHLPVKNEPRFESVEFKHSHVTDDLTKLVLYRRLIGMGCTELAERERRLLEKLAAGPYCYSRDGARLWHTTTYFDGDGLRAFTHHGTGLVGFPGGMATVARRLFEYCALNHNDSLEKMGKSAADWLVSIQREDRSWPASVGNGRNAAPGCVASTAEAVRALLGAYRRTENATYRTAAEGGIRYLDREESFFECRQYLRDVDFDNSDGMTAEACIHACLDWYDIVRDEKALAQAEKWAFYALQWVRPRSSEYPAEPSFDGLSRSITPRIDVWGGLLTARAFIRLARAAGRERWREHAWWLFENIASLQEHDGGFSETWFLDFPSGLESINIEPTFVTDAFVEFILDIWDDGENPLANVLSAERESVRRKHPPLKTTGEGRRLVTICGDRPEWIVDESLRLALAFDGAYDWQSGTAQAVYTMMREIAPGRWLLKLAPAAKILLSRHRVSRPASGIGRTSLIGVRGFADEDSENGRRARLFRTPFHEMTFSVISEGADFEGLPAANVGIDVKTLVGDVRINQARIDLIGRYEILSVYERGGFLVSSGGSEYSFEITEGSVDAVLREDGRLAFDITMSSNWNFFGEYRLRLRATRRSEKKLPAGY